MFTEEAIFGSLQPMIILSDKTVSVNTDGSLVMETIVIGLNVY